MAVDSGLGDVRKEEKLLFSLEEEEEEDETREGNKGSKNDFKIWVLVALEADFEQSSFH